LSKTNGKKEVLEKIKKWLDEESIEFTPEESSYLDFQLNIKEPNQSIFSYKDKPDSIEFATYAELKDEDKKAFIAFRNKDDEKFKILWDLQRSLIEINVEHELNPNFDNLEKVIIRKKVYFDALTKDKFMDTIFALQRGAFLVDLMHHQLGGKYYKNSTTKFML
jgi:hypothetical protein